MKTRHLCVAAGSAAVIALLAGCGSSSSTKTTTAPTSAPAAATSSAPAAADSSAPAAGTSSAPAQASGKVGVILPDTTTSPRWESQDRPNLQKALSAAGITPDIQNADGDKTKFGTICDSMVSEGVKVLMIVNLDSDSGSACLKKAQNAGIKTIDYDRLTLGGGASYYVSYDNVAVGKLQGQGLLDGLTAAGKTTGAQVAVIDGDPTDNNAALFKQGYLSVLDAAQTAGKIKIIGDQTGKWDATIAGTAFQQIVTANSGKVDGVLSANDTMAGGIIARLSQDGLAGPKTPVTGQDASVAGLQAILAGTQYMSVFKAASGEATAASTLAIDLINGTTPDATLVNGTTMDTVLKKAVPSVLLTPVAITKANIKDAIAGGATTAAALCTGATAAACTAAGIS